MLKKLICQFFVFRGSWRPNFFFRGSRRLKFLFSEFPASPILFLAAATAAAAAVAAAVRGRAAAAAAPVAAGGRRSPRAARKKIVFGPLRTILAFWSVLESFWRFLGCLKNHFTYDNSGSRHYMSC